MTGSRASGAGVLALFSALALAGPAEARLARATPTARAADVAADVKALIAQADALAAKAEFDEGITVAQRALALAETARPGDFELQFLAKRRLVVMQSFTDTAHAPEHFATLVPYAERAFGSDSFTAAFARFKEVQWGYIARRSGFRLPQLATATDGLAARARTDEERSLAAFALATLAQNTVAVDVAAARPIAASARAMAESVPHVVAAELGQTYQALAGVAMAGDQPALALVMCDRAIAQFEADQGKLSHHLVATLGIQATAARSLGDLGRAEQLLRRAVGILDSRPGLDGSFRARAYMDYARFLASRGQYELAFPLVERAVSESASQPPTAGSSQNVVVTAGQVYLEAARYDDALRHLRRALEMTERAGNAGLMQVSVLAEIGRAEARSGEPAAAQASAERAIAVAEKVTPPGHSARGDARMLLADLAEARGDSAGAAALYAQAASELTQAGPDGAALAAARIRGAAALARLDRLDEDGWRSARAGGDALIRNVSRIAATTSGDRFALGFAPDLLDSALDVAWARGHARAVAAK